MSNTSASPDSLSKDEFIQEVITDYIIAYKSRQASLIGRKEVLTGKAKFGIFGDGKEVVQVAMARYMRNGDFRAGYYRDQTLMFALGLSNIQKFFAQLYAHPSVEHEPSSAGRSMNGHFGTRMLDNNGEWLKQTDRINISSDISPTAGQMPRVLGLAFASKVYKENENLHHKTDFSDKGNEIAWGTIGNASTSEGHFWESINAAGVMQVPMLISIWDDEYGISVHAKHQTTKQNLTAILSGFKTDKFGKGIELITVNGWDYPALSNAYKKASEVCRTSHTPVVVHVKELTQPQGHSTSGSHERYKSPERLAWEIEHDCLKQMRTWVISTKLATEEEISALELDAEQEAKASKKEAWVAFTSEIKQEIEEACNVIQDVDASAASSLKAITDAGRKDILKTIHATLRANIGNHSQEVDSLKGFYEAYLAKYQDVYSSHLHSQSANSALSIAEVKPEYNQDSEELNGFEILNKTFDYLLSNHPEVIAFGEDVGKIGDVNQGFAGLQEKHGATRVMDMGIRENTIVGQAIGASLRGLRPIAEIQYLDYLLYGVQMMSDDIATVQYRTKGGQKYPLIIRTRGHRLEGIWHSGSPMGMILNAVRGMNVLVPRDMTRAAGFYNTLMQSDEPAIVVECLNGYRLKETLPTNLSSFTGPVGVPETLIEGNDVTVISYGSTLRIVEATSKQLEQVGIHIEVIDLQSLIPFDLSEDIRDSILKTNRLLIVDEDVPGGASSYILQQLIEKQNVYSLLDSAPKLLSAKAHRPAYGGDGDYFSKPSEDDIFEAVYAIMHEANPTKFPS